VDADIRTVLAAKRLVCRLATVLVTDPFNAGAHRELQVFPRQEAADARAAWRRLNALPDEEIARRTKAVLLSLTARGRR
jgi:hypothetical protein